MAVLLLTTTVCAARAESRRRAVAGCELLWYGRAVRRQQRQLADLRTLWGRALETDAIFPGLHGAARRLIGPEWAHFLSGETFDGLRDLHNPRYVVNSAAEAQMKLRMNQIEGGTIAVCGPRGAGKTTLLKMCSTEQQDSLRELAVFIGAPAEYSPHEFLLTLFDEVSTGYLKWSGAGEPDLDVFRPRRRRRMTIAVSAGLHALRRLSASSWLWPRCSWGCYRRSAGSRGSCSRPPAWLSHAVAERASGTLSSAPGRTIRGSWASSW
ncbi:hypothetical protein ACFTZ8_00375 [Streptomyces fungicidicus]|uniref:hypothetical protein n=1 Tax=Streptomyces fungicidicus TaxID=68203 RepID=UPI00363FC15A